MKDRATMGESTPICRCRVLYLGSAVPRQSKDGLQGIQEPLRSLYPSEGAIGAKGIDSWLSVWSNGILLENVDENRKQVTRFFPIDSLHYCAAVRQVLIPERGNSNPEPKFLPLDSPFARTPRAQHPPIFAAILRRTTGIKVLECHTFICKREAAANALVRCCFHAYADNSYARQLEGSGSGGSGSNSVYGTIGGKSNGTGGGGGAGGVDGGGWRSRAGSTTTLNSVGVSRQAINGVTDAYTVKNLYASSADLEVVDDGESSLYNGDENHKVWNGSTDQIDGIGFGNDGHYDIYSGPGSTAGGVGVGGGGGGGGGGSTLGRPARIRQISAPVPVPPPPKEEPKKSKKDKKLASKAAAASQQQQQQQFQLQQQLQHQHQLQLQQQQQVGGSQSLSGTLIRPRPMHMNPLGRPAGGAANHHHHHPHHPHHQSASSAAAMAAAAAAAHHGMMMYHPGGVGAGMPPPPVPGRQFHTIGHRSMNGGGAMAMAAMAAHAAAAAGHPSPSHPTHLLHPSHPSAHPAHLAGMAPLPAMMMAPQYATLQHPRTSKSKKNKQDKHGKTLANGGLNGGLGSNGGGPIPIGVPIVPPMFAYPPPQAMANGVHGDGRPLSMSNRKLAQSAAAGLDDVSTGGGGGGGTSGAESPGGTGIYRRKGHLNERAFSYSIRQEHRSRSHGSLASLQFNPPDLKKEREIAQMVAGLELTADDDSTLRRRSEVAGSSGTFGKPRR
ncbi:uncharacterized protein LOC126570880 [Anopheles aquasalis]|uniref:uncharacterized protein LOC126570880 n=1 Tax=Anopheles aquasalis TaxID=42839 RepID=UPI00215AB3C3|nr:uncharacterized protein LOC126570880 [Anopheles aquasalis]XP_050084907.1 uncharacterized protein LOC126570880 [Anopheles aquasalis]XP_050084908.1 uncharacterized protein LOC126570880 [Anopheles aquasalis]XP_050084909.1 uncharacterized protein LOC126570880 [Anopheles aquasalis]XP_050084910.1 uncharacterized protein LOC126570880 [Anopheles aquasalis]XP_050084911.1 uncharacterized protein LOC126570880 [Anopheles aquasalis]